MCKTIKNGEIVKAIFKQIASQEFQAEKEKCKYRSRWLCKKSGMTCKLSKNQRKYKKIFQVKIEVIREQLQEIEAKSIKLEKEIGFLRLKSKNLVSHQL